MIILTALVAGASILFVMAPLLGWGAVPAFETPAGGAARRREELLQRRQEILSSIKDLELEHAVGKLTREDYEQTREHLSHQAIQVYRELDEDAGA
jgi:hypothetical protein